MKLNKNFRLVCDYTWVDLNAWLLAWICARKHETMDVDGGSSGRFRYRYRFQRPSSAFIVSKSLDCLVKHEFLIWLLKWNNRKLCSVTSFRKRNNKKLCSVKYFPSTVRTRLQSWFISVQPRVRKERHGVGAKYGLRRRELSQESRISHQQGMKQIRVNYFNE